MARKKTARRKLVRKTNRGFTLIEIAASASLLFIILIIVFSATHQALDIFEREAKRVMYAFDVFGYFFRAEKILGRADQVKLLRSETGFYVLNLDIKNNKCKEVVHQFRSNELLITSSYSEWNSLSYENGEAVFEGKRSTAVYRNKTLMKDIKSVRIKIHRTKSGLLNIMKMVFTRSDKKINEKNKKKGTSPRRKRKIPKNVPMVLDKSFILGGGLDLNSKQTHLFQDSADE